MTRDTSIDDERTLAARVAELEQQNAELQKENMRLRRNKERKTHVASSIGRFSSLLILGPGLVKSLRAWLEKKSLGDPMPPLETAEVLASVLRRMIRVGVVGIVAASLPVLLLWWQVRITQDQNRLIGRQIEQQDRDSILARRAELLKTIYEEQCPAGGPREAAPSAEVSKCRPKAHPRARREAVLAFLGFERSRGVKPDLTGADLSGLDLRLADLSGVIITDVNLSGSKLREADMRAVDANYPDEIDDARQVAAGIGGIFGARAIVGVVGSGSSEKGFGFSEEEAADSEVAKPPREDRHSPSLGMPGLDTTIGEAFEDIGMSLQSDVGRGQATMAVIALGIGASMLGSGGSNFTGSNLLGVDLRGANLTNSNFSKAILFDANLSGAELRQANFSEAILWAANFENADLSTAIGLSREQLDLAFGSSETKLPDNLEKPAHWSLSNEDQRKHLLLPIEMTGARR